MNAVLLLAAAAAAAAALVAAQRPVSRRPEIKELFAYDSCQSTAVGNASEIECTTPETTLLSMTTALVSNTGLGTAYILEMDQDYFAGRLPPNRRLAKSIRLTYEVSEVTTKYALDLEARVPDRYILQKDTGSACQVSEVCNGRFSEAPMGEPCNTTKPYSTRFLGGRIKFRSPADDYFEELAVVPTDDMYRGFSAGARRCGAASCGVCQDSGQNARATCDTERFLMVYPMWSVFQISPWPFVAYSITARLLDLETLDAEEIELGMNLNLAPSGEPYRQFARAQSPGGTFVIEILQHTSLLPYPAVPGYIVAAEGHPRAAETCVRDPSICARRTALEQNQACPPGADARGLYCPVFDAWQEAADASVPQVNPRPQRCEPGPRYWFFAEQGRNGWRHGYECNENGIRPDWYSKNDGRNAAIPCVQQKGACVPGYDTSLSGGGDARKLPPFYPEQNRQQRGSVCPGGLLANGRCAQWDCDPRAPVNTPWSVQRNEGFWNTWLADGFMWVEPEADTNMFIDVNALISGDFVQVERIRGSGYLQSAGEDPCILVRNRDGGFMVDVCNDSPVGSDFAVDITCETERYQLGVGSTTVSVEGNRCVSVGPINIRLQGEIVPGGDFCTARLSELGTFAVIDELDERCQELAPRRQEPLGSGQSAADPEPVCKGITAIGCSVDIYISDIDLTWLLFAFGLGLLIIIAFLLVACVGSCIVMNSLKSL